MGALAESIKSAEAKVAAADLFSAPEPTLGGRRGELFKTFSELLRGPEVNPYSDLQRMSQFMPTSGQEAMRTGLKYTGMIGGAGAGLAALASLLSHLQASERSDELMRSVLSAGSVPGREYPVPFKFAKADDGMEKKSIGLGGAALIGTLLGLPLAYAGGKKLLNKGTDVWREMFTPTSNPLTHPAAIPLILGGSVALTAGSYKMFDYLFDRMRERRKKREMEAAERDFQEALRAQYLSPKAASIGEAVDGLAAVHVSGELQQQLSTLEKHADDMENPNPFQPAPWYRGVGSGAAGIYATLALLLALGGGFGAYSMAKKRDVSRRRREALERALRRRAMASPPQFIVERPDELGEEPI